MNAIPNPPPSRRRSPSAASQRGGFFIGLVVGLLIGLAAALGVALYVTKAPIPFVNKVPARPQGQDAADAERDRNWDPNGSLAGKNPMTAASGTVAITPNILPPPGLDPMLPAASAPPRSVSASGAATTAALTPGAPATRPPATPATPGMVQPTVAGDPFTYFVQAGAFSRTEDAEQQRARLGLLGVESKVTEREQSGRTVYRVRVGPFDRKDAADGAKQKLADSGVDSALVRVQK